MVASLARMERDARRYVHLVEREGGKTAQTRMAHDALGTVLQAVYWVQPPAQHAPPHGVRAELEGALHALTHALVLLSWSGAGSEARRTRRAG
jgi:hypothetical protein